MKQRSGGWNAFLAFGCIVLIIPLLWSLSLLDISRFNLFNVQEQIHRQEPSSNFDKHDSQLARRSSNKSPVQQNPAMLGIVPAKSPPPPGAELCDVGKPCPDESCCGISGTCGYGPEFCGSGNCTSNCDATAMCGIYSANGNASCGMNLCCSSAGWCGTTSNYCINADPGSSTLPCQKGYGLCEIVPAPVCATSKDTTAGRQIGYYQAANVYSRLCNRISPSQIVTTGYTHLYFAFASIDPHTFQVTPTESEDVKLYTEFTALQGHGLETWIAIGGFDFSDNDTATHSTWSVMTSTKENRAAFISSTITFMGKYKFQGVDLDWEYPGASDRGGGPKDTQNFVLLVQEMHAAFKGQYGLSLTLAPDYWYLRNFDAIAMQPYVSWFGFMAYDLHGYWDGSNPNLGPIVRSQTDIRSIANDTAPLWFDGLDPGKINFGLALYGRGYTLAEPNCKALGCPFSGPSKPGQCTDTAGVLSLLEIEQVIAEYNLKPTLLEESMIMQITWLDQWIGYDNEETFALKKAWANGQCFGGTMYWSVDFNSGVGSGNNPNKTVTTDGSCGLQHNNTICGDWPAGNCCSASGYCGKTPAHCGNGCQSGDCITGGQSTDGTCGAQWNNAFCGNFTAGSCCSEAGYCGSGEAYCSLGKCQSGPCGNGSGIIYPPPSIWSSPEPAIGCYPPCTVVLPPLLLPTPVTVKWPPITTSLWSLSGTVTTIITTIVTIPVFTTDTISFWYFTVGTNDGLTGTIEPQQSVVPPAFTLTLSSGQASMSPTEGKSTSDGTPLLTTGWASPSCFPFPQQTGTQATTTTSIIGGGGGGGGGTTSTPTSTGLITSSKSLSFSQTSPDSHDSGCKTHCGVIDCRFGCGGGCGLFGCGGGCGLFGCGGGCGLFGCTGIGGGGGGGGGGGPGKCSTCTEPKTSTSSCETKTSTSYWVSCLSSSCTTTKTEVITGCTVTGSATTTTGNSCPLPTYDASLEDMGDPLPAGVSFTSTTTSIPESVVFHGSTYTVSDGSIVVGGSAVSVVAVTAKTVVTIDGAAATVFPGLTGVVPMYNNLTALGFRPSTTTKEMPTTATTIITTSTSRPSPTSSSSPPPPPKPSNYVLFNLEEDMIGHAQPIYQHFWVTFDWTVGDKPVNLCGTNPTSTTQTTTTANNPDYPDGKIGSFTAHGVKGCVYSGGSHTTIGKMTCPGVTGIMCRKSPQYNQKFCQQYGTTVVPVLECYW
ncbi:Acidic mammalian chitinase [Cladobotryum mycophilum]|uniref:chitinase n=1 Tax=Cladobotryum mycophilum TaxID=491253 RepID=A0ABR0SDU6_9HYPO